MASTVRHLRSSTASKRPTASGLTDGQLAINTASGTPGLFLKDSAGAVVKVGPAHVGASAPNAVPAGSAGNSTGELWVNNSTTINGLNYYTGSAFVNLTPSGTATIAGLVELATPAETQTGSDGVRAVTPSGLQSKVSDSISTTSSTTIASSTAVKSAYDLANAALPKAGGVVTGTLEIGTTGSLSFEGSIDDSFETTIAVVNPTADRTITFPNVTGTVVTTGDSGTVTSAMIANGAIVDADVNASAAIALSKLATGALPSGITIASSNIVDGTIVNADVNAAAGIVYGKLALSSGIVNTDISGSAAIALDKLATGALPTAITIASANIVDGTIVNGDINASAAIVDTKLATISTAGKVSNSATTATSANTASGIVARDGSGNFTAGTITAALTGAASSNVLKAGDTMTGVLAVTAGTAALPGLAVSGDPNTGIYSPGADQLAVATNGSGRLFIDASGRVGVGAASPLEELHIASVNPAVLLQETDAGTDQKYWRNRVDNNTCIFEGLTDAFTSPSFWLRAVRSTDSAQIDRVEFATAGTERLRITSAGLVGIGTSAPDTLLTVSQSAPTDGILAKLVNPANASGSEAGIRLQHNNSTQLQCDLVTFRSGANAGLDFNIKLSDSSGTPQTRFTILEGGNVGIGTSAPVNLLHVQGDATFEANAGGQFTIRGSTNSQNRLNFGFHTTDNYAWIQAITAGTAFRPIALNPSGGSVGIGTGTTAPGGTLDIKAPSATAPLIVQGPSSEFARIDSSGRLLVGISTGLALVHIGNAVDNLFMDRNESVAGCPNASFRKSRGTAGAPTIVNADDLTGALQFRGYDGAAYITNALIRAEVDGTPGTNDMPGRLVFSTTADGASTPTERMRIGSTGVIAIGSTTTTGGGSGCSLRFANDLTGATTPVSILGTPQILADATATASVFMSQPGAAVTGATLGDVRHFIANSFSMGAGTTAANQIGFLATSSLTAATNNYGFRSNIAAGTGRWAFYADGTADSYFASSNFIFANGGTERARVDSSGRLLVGTSSALSTRLGFTALIAPVQVAGNTFNNNSSLLASYASGATGNSYLAFARSKSNVVGTDTAVIANDRLGAISFAGFDGTNQTEAVRIFAEVDGIPGADDMPGRLVFSTTADGAAAPTERLRITNDGVQAYDQPAPAAVNATATLTVANLKTGIITSTSAAATDMTLPTGTDTQAGFSGTYDNFTFEWSVINTGPSLVRVLAGTAHTIVGSGSVATGTSGRFASRRTAANTFVTYRLS